MTTIESSIYDELERVEDEHDIKVINARVRGSRMLGVEHDDSDWDIMFLFAQEPYKYAMQTEGVEVIDWPGVGKNGDVDLHGWNITKFRDLLLDSNPNAIEYCTDGSKEYLDRCGYVFHKLTNNAVENFNHMSLYFHYISMAKRNYEKYVSSGNDCTLGRQFYVARATACAQYIRKNGKFPPMNVSVLAKTGGLETDLASKLMYLSVCKMMGYGNEEACDMIGDLFEQEAQKGMKPTDERINHPDRELADGTVKTILTENFN